MKTTKTHFKIFKKECQKWIDAWGIRDWQVYYETTDIKGIFGQFKSDYKNRVATIVLCKDWDDALTPLTNEEIRRIAKHETIHLLFAEMSTIGSARCVTADELDEAEHKVVRRLEKIL